MQAVPPEPRRDPSRKPGLQRHEYDPNQLTQSAFMSHRTSWVPHSLTSETVYGLVQALLTQSRLNCQTSAARGRCRRSKPTCRRHRHDDGAAPAARDVSGDQPLQGGVDDPVDLRISWFLTDLYPNDEERSSVQPARTHAHASATTAAAGMTG